MAKVVLDIGAGPFPDRRATHALDVSSKTDISEVYRRVQRKRHLPLRIKTQLKKLRELAKVDRYYAGVDFGKRKNLPKDLIGKVDLFVSEAALPAFVKGDIAGKNLALLSAPNARAEIKQGYVGNKERREYAAIIKQALKAGGFGNIKVADHKEVSVAGDLASGDLRITAQRGNGTRTSGYADTSSTGEIWRIPQQDYVKSLKGQRIDRGPKPYYYNRLGQLIANHRHAVEAAFQLGKPIPPEVLAGYPELQREVARRTAGHKDNHKEPWQMTQAEFEQDWRNRQPKAPEVSERHYAKLIGEWHETFIKRAIKGGKPVPAEVLKDYPNLQKTAGYVAECQPKMKAPFTDKTDLPYYDAMLKNPELYRREKGKTFEIRWVSPDEYLQMSAKAKGVSVEDDRRFSEDTLIHEYATAMRRGDKFPMLMVEAGRQLQEGKHRALAAKEAGINKIPVMIVTETGEQAAKIASGSQDKDLAEKQRQVKIVPILTTTDGVTVYLVSGKLIKLLFNMDFVEGSNHYAPNAQYVPEKEAWVDNTHEPEQQDDVALHELHERNLMKPLSKGGLGFPYGIAHNFANLLEKKLRVGELKLPQGEDKARAMTELANIKPYERAYATKFYKGKGGLHVHMTPAHVETARHLATRHNGQKPSTLRYRSRKPLLITSGGRKLKGHRGTIIKRRR